jgi:hypothetical protein
MKKPALTGAIIFAASFGVVASPAWSGGGHHRNSASEDSSISPRVESEAPRDFSSQNDGGGVVEGMDGYAKDSLAESRTVDNQASGVWEEQTQDESSIAMRQGSADESWYGIESKDDRDFHS